MRGEIMERNKSKAILKKKKSSQKQKWNLLDKINELLLESTKTRQTMGA